MGNWINWSRSSYLNPTSGIRVDIFWLGFNLCCVNHWPLLLWIMDNPWLYLFYLTVLTMHIGKYAWEFFCSLWMKRYSWLLDEPNLLIHLHLGMMTKLKLRISIVEYWMLCLVLWLIGSLRKSHLLRLPMKHDKTIIIFSFSFSFY